MYSIDSDKSINKDRFAMYRNPIGFIKVLGKMMKIRGMRVYEVQEAIQAGELVDDEDKKEAIINRYIIKCIIQPKINDVSILESLPTVEYNKITNSIIAKSAIELKDVEKLKTSIEANDLLGYFINADKLSKSVWGIDDESNNGLFGMYNLEYMYWLKYLEIIKGEK